MGVTEEELNFLRCYFLNLKIASNAVRVYFDYVHPPAGLSSELANSSVTLKGLRFMTKLQLNILYPSSSKFELCLLSICSCDKGCLIRMLLWGRCLVYKDSAMLFAG